MSQRAQTEAFFDTAHTILIIYFSQQATKTTNKQKTKVSYSKYRLSIDAERKYFI